LPWHQVSARSITLRVGGVDHQRHLDQAHQLGEERFDVRDLVAVGVLQADVDDLRAAAHLGAADLGGGLVVAASDELLELARAEHVGALADEERPVVGGELDGLDAGDERALVMRDRARP
jgi:hypothetical protein